MTRLSEEDNCLNENLLRMPTSPPGAVAVGFADSAEPEFHAQCDKPASVQFIHEVPSEPKCCVRGHTGRKCSKNWGERVSVLL